MASAESSAQRRLLKRRKFLRRVFFYLPENDRISCALVCNAWSEVALCYVWDGVYTLRQTLALLEPLTFTGKKPELLRPLTPDDWDRFEHYAWRIHFFCPADTGDFDLVALCALLKSARDEAGLDDPLFPNMTTFCCENTPIEFVDLMLSPALRSATFSINTITSNEIGPNTACQSLLADLPSRAPQLAYLTLLSLLPWSADLETTLAQMCKQLTCLHSLEIPERWLSPSFTNSLASHTELQTLRTSHPNLPDQPPPDFDSIFSTTLTADSFPQLESIHLNLPFNRVSSSLSQEYDPHRLTSIFLWSPQFESVEVYASLLKVISSRCPMLESLMLSAPQPVEPLELNPFATELTFDMIKPILPCAQLTSLSLHHQVSFQLENSDVVHLAQSLPNLRFLKLNHEPKIRLSLGITISLLADLIPFCEKLTDLHLCLNASEWLIPTQIPPAPFKVLDTLGLGYSRIPSAVPVAKFLVHVLPDGCFLFPRSRHGDEDAGAERAWQRWDLVRDLVPALIKARDQGRKSACNCPQ